MNPIAYTLRLIALCVMVMVSAIAAATPATHNQRAERHTVYVSPEAATATPTTMAEVQRILPLVDAAWPNSPCKGRITVVLDDEAGILRFAGLDTAAQKGRTVGGAATLNKPGADPNCNTHILGNLHGVKLCKVLVHEGGHLSGEEHSLDPRSIMFEEGGIWQACDALFAATTRYSSATVASVAVSDALGIARNDSDGLDMSGPGCQRRPYKKGSKKHPRYLCSHLGVDASGNGTVESFQVTVWSNYYGSNGLPQASVRRISYEKLERLRSKRIN